MSTKLIIVKPILSEKSEYLSDKKNQYSFVVDKGANKIQIKKAFKELYEITPECVNTCIIAGKEKSRMNKRGGVMKGRKASYKKAIITLPEGESIDLLGKGEE